MNKISKHWVNIKKDEDKGYDVGFERVIYSLLQHGSSDLKNANSSPIGSDLMFECDDAIIHIDLKSNQPLTNIGDHWQPKIEAKNMRNCQFYFVQQKRKRNETKTKTK